MTVKEYLNADLSTWHSAYELPIPLDKSVLMISGALGSGEVEILTAGIGKVAIQQDFVKILSVDWEEIHWNPTYSKHNNWTITHWKWLEPNQLVIPLEL